MLFPPREYRNIPPAHRVPKYNQSQYQNWRSAEEQGRYRMDWKRTIAYIGVAAALSIPAVAQNATPTDSTKTPVINQRQRDQQARIHQGVHSGQLTGRETRNLERQQAHIQHTKQKDKADGNVTPQERAQLTRMQNRASRDIYRDKHNNRTQQ